MLFMFLACTTTTIESKEKEMDSQVDSAESEDTDTDTDSGDPQTEPASEPSLEPSEEPASEPDDKPEDDPQIVRFIVMGDGGEGNDAQYKNSEAIEAVCAQKNIDRPGCEFVLYLGDNFYDDGVDGVNDPQFQSKFEDPYSNLTLPFYVVLGNHDYGETSLERDKSSYEIDYTNQSDKWYLPSEYYTVIKEHISFYGLDTNQIMLEDLTWLGWGGHDQDSWLDNELATTTSTWTIAYGHHPYVSNGKHGNAGEYEGYSWLPVASGDTIKEFFDDHVCGKIDVYFAGHDHNRQWLEPTCGTEFIVSGAAAKTSDLVGRGSPTFFEDDQTPGFLWVEIRDNCMYGEFYDMNGTMDFSHQVCK